MTLTSKENLIELYSNKSKHSNYQILPSALKSLLAQDDIQTTTRSETERLKYVLSKIDVKDKTVLDIGANTGYFSFELLDAGAKSMHCYEGNEEHTNFVKLAADALNLNDKMQVTNDYFNFDGSHNAHYDIGLLFNVLHHVGDDYGDKDISIEKAKRLIIQQLNNMSATADTLVFQLGFNWRGNSTLGLFTGGSKKEMIEFIREGITAHWQIVSIGIAERIENQITYVDVNDNNIERDDSMGEFLNRPIFVLKSKN